jgi:hypothetical protein
MTSLLGEERGGPSQGDEMTFSNIAGVLPAVDKVRCALAQLSLSFSLLTFHYKHFLAVAVDRKFVIFMTLPCL